ncbi:MAG: hypothetical protein ACYSWZ_00925 [Planctomycetota bacterium]|jgi:hypothetical protein
MLEALFVIVGSFLCLVAIFGGFALVMGIAESRYRKTLPWTLEIDSVTFSKSCEHILEFLKLRAQQPSTLAAMYGELRINGLEVCFSNPDFLSKHR